MIKAFSEYISEGLWTNSLKRSKGEEFRKEDNEFIEIDKRRKKLDNDKSAYPIEGYDGWYLKLDAHMNIMIYNTYSDYCVCDYTTEYDDDDRIVLASDYFEMRTRDEIYMDDDLTIEDDEDKIINSNDFYTAIDKTLNKLPKSAFKKNW